MKHDFSETVVHFLFTNACAKCLQNYYFLQREISYMPIFSKRLFLIVFTISPDSLMTSQNASFGQDKKIYA